MHNHKNEFDNLPYFNSHLSQIYQKSFIIVSNMNKPKDPKPEEDDISIIKSKRKRQKVFNKKKDPFLFKPTESDAVSDSNDEGTSRVNFSENDEQKQRKINEKTKQFRNESGKIFLDVPRSNGILNQGFNNDSKLVNINLTSSIPFTLVHKDSQKSEGLEQRQRRFKIFPQQQVIKFEIPPLDQYYTKHKQEYEMNMSMGMNDQASINRQLNGSQYSFFGFRHGEPKVAKKSTFNIGSTTKSRHFAQLGKPTSMNMKNNMKIYEDEIKQQSYEDEEHSNKQKQKIVPKNVNNIKDYQTKGIYLLLGFLMSTIAMILIRNFM